MLLNLVLCCFLVPQLFLTGPNNIARTLFIMVVYALRGSKWQEHSVRIPHELAQELNYLWKSLNSDEQNYFKLKFGKVLNFV